MAACSGFQASSNSKSNTFLWSRSTKAACSSILSLDVVSSYNCLIVGGYSPHSTKHLSSIACVPINRDMGLDLHTRGFSSRKKEEIYKMDDIHPVWSPALGKQSTSKMQLLRRFILLTELLHSEYQADYIIIDTSPGIRYWSLNALTVADTLLLTLKMGDLDVDGTTTLVAEIYDSFTKFGTKSFLLWNRVAGYCIPHNAADVNTTAASLQTEASENLVPPVIRESSLLTKQQTTETDMKDFITRKTEMKVITSIPCYCDIQFSTREFLTVLEHPHHPFTKQFEQLVQALETI